MQAKWHAHPRTGRGIFGVLLEDGVRLEKEDVYDSTSGKWEKCPCPGVILNTHGGAHVIWIRPCVVPSDL